jgi:molecular chaperone GrpE
MSKKNDARKDDVPQDAQEELEDDFLANDGSGLYSGELEDSGSSNAPVENKPKTPDEQIAELTDLLKRKQAEFMNYQTRMEAMQKEQAKYASLKVIEKLVPVLELFDMAVAHKDKKDDFIAGMEMVHKQLNDVLTSEGVVSESLLNKPFDPVRAQAMSVVERDDVAADTVVTEYQKCYRLGNRVLRHAKVVVSKKKQK